MTTIRTGDTVSFRLGGTREFGTVYEVHAKSFRVICDDGVYRVIPARSITKECE